MNYPNEIISKSVSNIIEHFKDKKRIMISISGGSDSDVMIDIILRAIKDNKNILNDKELHFVYFDIGIDNDATRRHLDYLENKYNIVIERIKPQINIPMTCELYGPPFLTKYVSDILYRLQLKGFDFKNDGNKSFDYLINKYPKSTSLFKWWCDKYDTEKPSKFSISATPYLKEFLIENPPNFKISGKCCECAKRKPSKLYEKDIEIKCVGIRKAEGGIRANTKDSYTKSNMTFRPIFWFSDKDKALYKSTYNIKNSDCYEVWGLKRTGCSGCPLNSKYNEELATIKKYEPNLYSNCIKTFGKSYEYTEKYKEFKEKMKALKRLERKRNKELSKQ
ncbi:MAG: phosphoadenosine phosphosulfate reductase family protein [Clostridia bacterium]|nr:phosphoadenosine phosphosulfate reductase family protein [Clostridia bacterium]